jgi:hypothetical protein
MAIKVNALEQSAIADLIKQLEKSGNSDELIAQLKPKLDIPKVEAKTKNGKPKKQNWTVVKEVEILQSKTSILKISLSKGEDGTLIVGERKFYKNKEGELRATKDGFAVRADKAKIDEQIAALELLKLEL